MLFVVRDVVVAVVVAGEADLFDGVDVPELPPDGPATTPPCRVLAALDLTFGKKSEMRGPDAEGGGFGVEFACTVAFGAGDWFRDDPADDTYGDAVSEGT